MSKIKILMSVFLITRFCFTVCHAQAVKVSGQESAIALSTTSQVTPVTETVTGQQVAPEVIVSATKEDLPVSQVGSSYSLITEKDISKSGMLPLSDLLRSASGLTVQQTGSFGSEVSAYIRGGNDNQFLVLINGVKVNTFGFIGGYDFSALSSDNIERIEVLKGAQSALYGAEAMTGLINIITKKGTGKPSLTLDTEMGVTQEPAFSDDVAGIRAPQRNILTLQESVALSGGVDKTGYSLSVSRFDTQGIYQSVSDMNGNDISNNSFARTSLSGRVYGQAVSQINLDLSGVYTSSIYHYPTNYVPGDTQFKGFPPVDPFEKQNVNELSLGLKAEHTVWGPVSGTLQLGQLLRSTLIYNDNGVTPPMTFYQTLSNENRGTFAYYMEAPFDFSPFHESTQLGAEYELENYQNDPTPLGVDESRYTASAYLQQQFSLGDFVFLNTGVRHNQNQFYGESINPSVSLAFYLNQLFMSPGQEMVKAKLHSSYGTGIKAPGFSELFNTAFSTGNSSLKPERSQTWDVGVDTKLLGGMVDLDVTHFENLFYDLIEYVSVGPVNYLNIAEAETSGTEITLLSRLNSNLELRGSYTNLMTGTIDDGGIPTASYQNGARLLRRPMNQGSLSADWQIEPFTVSSTWTSVGSREDLDGNTGLRIIDPPFDRVDMTMTYLLAKDWMALSMLKLKAHALNMGDSRYEEVAGFPNPGRTIMAGLEAKFE